LDVIVTQLVNTITLREMDVHFQGVEGVLNWLGYIPLVSLVSGSLRVIYGTMEVGLGLLLAVKLFAESKISSDNEKLYLQEAQHQLQYVAHGFANIVRGWVEICFIVGNILTFIYDYFEIRCKYSDEEGGMREVTLSTSLADVQEFFINIEKLLNRLGHFPVVSSFSGSFRMQYGIFQVGMSLLLAAMQAMVSVYEKNYEFETSKAELDYLVHGLRNIFRGWIETCFLTGNIATSLYDESDKRYRYQAEFDQQGRIAIADAKYGLSRHQQAPTPTGESPQISDQEHQLFMAIADQVNPEEQTPAEL